MKIQVFKGPTCNLDVYVYVRVSVGIKVQILPHRKSNANQNAEQGLSEKQNKSAISN